MSSNSENNSVYKFKKKYVKDVLVLLIVIAVVLISIFLYKYYQSNYSYVLKINNETVFKREFNQAMVRNRTRIYTYINNKYGVEDNKDFWQSSYGGEIPIEIAKKEAMNECIRLKIEQILAKEKGIIEDITYSAFLKKLSSENAKRKETVENNGIVYGPIQYDEDNYFSHVHSNMVIRLKEKLEENELEAKDEELRNYYESVKSEKFTKEDYVKVQKIYLPFGVEDAGESITVNQEKKNRIEEAKLRLDKGEAFDVVAKAFNKEGAVLEQIFDDSTARADSQMNSELKAQAFKLAVGQISEIFEAKNTFYIIKCVDRKSMDFKLFEEVKETVKIDYINKKYEEFIDELVKKANIEINKKVYGKIVIK